MGVRVEVPELPGCAAHGWIQEVALANAQQAINLPLKRFVEIDSDVRLIALLADDLVFKNLRNIGIKALAFLRCFNNQTLV
jgi:hypothetical protein